MCALLERSIHLTVYSTKNVSYRHRLMDLNMLFFSTGILWYMCLFFSFCNFFLKQFSFFFIVSWIIYTCCASLNVKFHGRRKNSEARSNFITSIHCPSQINISNMHTFCFYVQDKSYLHTLWLGYSLSPVELNILSYVKAIPFLKMLFVWTV